MVVMKVGVGSACFIANFAKGKTVVCRRHYISPSQTPSAQYEQLSEHVCGGPSTDHNVDETALAG